MIIKYGKYTLYHLPKKKKKALKTEYRQPIIPKLQTLRTPFTLEIFAFVATKLLKGLRGC